MVLMAGFWKGGGLWLVYLLLMNLFMIVMFFVSMCVNYVWMSVLFFSFDMGCFFLVEFFDCSWGPRLM